jgi:putative lipoic acid-binding regulatory protein
MKRSEAIALLEQHHSFPGPYVFKLIGDNTSHFYDTVLAEVAKEFGEMGPGWRFSTRKSSGGRYLSITLTLQMESGEHVVRFYERFSKLDELRSMM